MDLGCVAAIEVQVELEEHEGTIGEAHLPGHTPVPSRHTAARGGSTQAQILWQLGPAVDACRSVLVVLYQVLLEGKLICNRHSKVPH